MLDFLDIDYSVDGEIAVEVFTVQRAPAGRARAKKQVIEKIKTFSIAKQDQDQSGELSPGTAKKLITTIKKVYEKASALPEWNAYITACQDSSGTNGANNKRFRFNIRLVKVYMNTRVRNYNVLRMRYSDDQNTTVLFSDIFVAIVKIALLAFPILGATCYYEQDDTEESAAEFGELVIHQKLK